MKLNPIASILVAMMALCVRQLPAQTPPPPAPKLSVNPPSSAGFSRLDPMLNQLWASRNAPQFRGDRTQLDHLLDADQMVQAVVVRDGRGAAELGAELRSLGVVEDRRYAKLHFVRVPLVNLGELAGLPGVVRVRRPFRARPMVVSEGVALHQADQLHLDGATGAGVKVGILDCGGFSGYQALLGSELPAAVTLWQDASVQVGTDVHGTGCAEIIHDMAPDAELFFAHDSDEAEFYAAMDWFMAQGVDIVSYSCGWQGEFPRDGYGAPHNSVNAKVEELRAAGILVVVSAGNYATDDTYQAPYVAFPGYAWHSWEGDWSNGVFSWSGSGYDISLTWDDWPADPSTSGSTQDYNMELYHWDGAAWTVVASSNNPQSGNPGEIPFESISFNPPLDEWYYLTVSKANATRDVYLNVTKFGHGGFIHHNPEKSLGVPAESPAALAVGAIFWSDLALEGFSSRGPTLGFGGTGTGGFFKPDLVAADGTSCDTYGTSDGTYEGDGFVGTSAAAPHVAGGAALVLSALPGLDADTLAAQLTSSAVDMGAAGPDTFYGHGRMQLDTSVIFEDGLELGGATRWSAVRSAP